MAVPTASDNIFPKLILDEGGALGTVSAGERRLGIDANGVLVWKNSGGTTSPLVALNKWDATTAPTANEDSGDGYQVGSRWIDTTNNKEYVCLDATVAAAVWTETTGGGASASDLTAADYLRTAGNYTTTSASFTDVDGTNLALSITTGARRCLVSLAGSMQNSTAVFYALDLLVDGTSVTSGNGIVSGNGTAIVPCSFTFLTDVLTAASHTFKLQYKTSGGTLTLYGAGSGGTALHFAVTELYAG